MSPASTPRIQTQALKEKIKARQFEAQTQLAVKHPHAKAFFEEKGLNLGHIRRHSAKLLTAGTLAGTLLLSSPNMAQLPPPPPMPAQWVDALTSVDMVRPQDPQGYLVDKLKEVLPQPGCPLAADQEKQVGLLIEKMTGIKARATLEGEHLNTCFGLIGAEQHLPRFPGDTVSQHDAWQTSGVTPGRGAWGYFAWSQSKMTKDDVLREKYYVAVQTLYLPDWDKRLKYLADWYKYRKVLVLNPTTGKAVVAVVADAGPAAWTGKQFGGSPEVMNELGYHTHMRKGPVLLLFVDDPENKVPLGPVRYQTNQDLPVVQTTTAELKI